MLLVTRRIAGAAERLLSCQSRRAPRWFGPNPGGTVSDPCRPPKKIVRKTRRESLPSRAGCERYRSRIDSACQSSSDAIWASRWINAGGPANEQNIETKDNGGLRKNPSPTDDHDKHHRG